MRNVAQRNGLRHLIAPVRPSWKDRYPLTPIQNYVRWRRPDGQLLDPWMQTHERLGARVATPLPRSLRITGTVADWASWTGLAFPETGDYVFPQGLATVHIDRDRDTGHTGSPTSGSSTPTSTPDTATGPAIPGPASTNARTAHQTCRKLRSSTRGSGCIHGSARGWARPCPTRCASPAEWRNGSPGPGRVFRRAATTCSRRVCPPVHIDWDRGSGQYWEPNVWLIHRS